MERIEIEGEAEEMVSMILKELAGLPLEEMLGYALKGEEDAIGLYTMLAEKIEEPHAKMRFGQFIKSEKGHREKILRIFSELFPDRQIPEVASPTWADEVKHEIKTVGDYLEVLEVAIRSEKLAEKMYASMAGSLSGERYGDIFTSLAEDERRHYAFLISQYRFYRRAKVEENLHGIIESLIRKE
ncbi:ferritin family protein [Thermococcus sp.]